MVAHRKNQRFPRSAKRSVKPFPWLVVFATLAALLGLSACTTAQPVSPAPSTPPPVVRVAALKGPTGMGLAKLATDASPRYQISIAGDSPDGITAPLVRGDLDAALIPANLAAVLYAKTNGAIQVAAVNTLGVLYVVEKGDTVHTLADLAGKTVLTTGKGATPQYVMDFLLSQADLATSVTLQYRSESTEVAAALAGGQATLGVLPEPYVSTVLAKDPSLRVALDLTKEWDAVAPGSQLVTGVLVVRKDFAAANPGAFTAFLADYQKSVAFANDHPDEAAPLIAGLGIVPSAAIAEQAIPRCHIVYLTGEQARDALSGYLTVLEAANPASVGGQLPGDDFYYRPYQP